MKYEALLEDEDNIFGGSPQSKFWDIVNQASDDLVKEQIDRFVERYAIMETILMKEHGEEGIDQVLEKYAFENSAQIDNNKKSTYVEWTGEIVCRLDS